MLIAGCPVGKSEVGSDTKRLCSAVSNHLLCLENWEMRLDGRK